MYCKTMHNTVDVSAQKFHIHCKIIKTKTLKCKSDTCLLKYAFKGVAGKAQVADVR